MFNKYLTLLALMTIFVLQGCGGKKETMATENLIGIKSMSQMVIYPNDLEATKTFYTEKLGFNLDYPIGGGSVKGYQLSTASIALTILDIQNGPKTTIENFMVHIRVNDVNDTYKKMTDSEVKIIKDIEDTDWGVRWFHIMDPNGLTIVFEQKVVAQKQ